MAHNINIVYNKKIMLFTRVTHVQKARCSPSAVSYLAKKLCFLHT
jgi:hypothetical protein